MNCVGARYGAIHRLFSFVRVAKQLGAEATAELIVLVAARQLQNEVVAEDAEDVVGGRLLHALFLQHVLHLANVCLQRRTRLHVFQPRTEPIARQLVGEGHELHACLVVRRLFRVSAGLVVGAQTELHALFDLVVALRLGLWVGLVTVAVVRHGGEEERPDACLNGCVLVLLAALPGQRDRFLGLVPDFLLLRRQREHVFDLDVLEVVHVFAGVHRATPVRQECVALIERVVSQRTDRARLRFSLHSIPELVHRQRR